MADRYSVSVFLRSQPGIVDAVDMPPGLLGQVVKNNGSLEAKRVGDILLVSRNILKQNCWIDLTDGDCFTASRGYQWVRILEKGEVVTLTVS